MLIHLDEPKHTARISIRKAGQILKLKPDVILFEYPQEFKPTIKKLRESVKRYPWLIGDIKIFEAIEKLRSQDRKVLLFNIDGPVELTSAGEGTKDLENMVWNFLREQYMIKVIKKVKSRFPRAKIVVLCHNFHWKNIKFLLQKSSKKEIKKHYNFLGFSKINLKNKVLRKYWNRLGV